MGIKRNYQYPNPRGSIHSMPRGNDCKVLSPFFVGSCLITLGCVTTGTAFDSLMSRTLRLSCQKFKFHKLDNHKIHIVLNLISELEV